MGFERSRHSELGDDELECILRKLSFLDILRFKRVCRKWFRVAETYASSPSYRPCFQAPWLVFPHRQVRFTTHYEGVEGERSLSFFNPDEKRLYSDVRKLGEDQKGGCVGSSHGWLVFLDRNANLCIFNPFSDDGADAHNIHRVGSLRQGLKLTPYDEYCETAFPNDLVRKTVVMSGSKFNMDKDGVVLIYGRQKKLACRSCKDGGFMDLDGVHDPYCDIICIKDNKVVCALSRTGSVEMWDFSHGSSFPPAKIMDMRPPFPSKTAELKDNRGRPDCTQYYLVESCGSRELLFVVRFVGMQGETFLFHVYRLDREGKKWVEMERLGDEVVFLGRNQSMSLSVGDCPGCVKNSIYFTNDDTWLQDKDVWFYNLQDKSVQPIYQNHRYMKKKLAPPVPFWILPNPW